ncbi:hypothetical protein PYW07_008659 [Mythimna separata]|uniref:Uncharacterized protein n=1 Tax=Mythimna separata TaxID=271217 RepID=A0AAD7YDW3_MYTSE|nr:hypothetical protein PYW07_008659 [Mythimna separata]
MPVFVARDLEKLPPITFDHLDVSKLLKDLTLVRAEIKDIKESCVTLDQLEEFKKQVTTFPVTISSTDSVSMKSGACRDEELASSLSLGSVGAKRLDISANSSLVLGENSSCDANRNKSQVEGSCYIITNENKNPLPRLPLSSARSVDVITSSLSTDNGICDQLGDSIEAVQQTFASAAKQQC